MSVTETEPDFPLESLLIKQCFGNWSCKNLRLRHECLNTSDSRLQSRFITAHGAQRWSLNSFYWLIQTVIQQSSTPAPVFTAITGTCWKHIRTVYRVFYFYEWETQSKLCLTQSLNSHGGHKLINWFIKWKLFSSVLRLHTWIKKKAVQLSWIWTFPAPLFPLFPPTVINTDRPENCYTNAQMNQHMPNSAP